MNLSGISPTSLEINLTLFWFSDFFLLFGIILSLLGSCQATVWVRVGSEKFFRIYSCKLINFVLKIFLLSNFFIFLSWGSICAFLGSISYVLG